MTKHTAPEGAIIPPRIGQLPLDIGWARVDIGWARLTNGTIVRHRVIPK